MTMNVQEIKESIPHLSPDERAEISRCLHVGEADELKQPKHEMWPEDFFDAIHITDENFKRPEQGLAKHTLREIGKSY